MRLNDGDEVVSLALVDKSDEPEDEDDVVLEPGGDAVTTAA
jgi:hypothetical protein